MERGVNRVHLIGNLGKDPDIKFLPSGDQVASFSVATSEVWKDKQSGEQKEQTEWTSCVAFGALAKIIGEHLHKGSKVYLEGKLRTESYEKDGEKRYITKVRVSELQMLGGAREGDESRQKRESKPAQNQSSFDSGFDDDIPF